MALSHDDMGLGMELGQCVMGGQMVNVMNNVKMLMGRRQDEHE